MTFWIVVIALLVLALGIVLLPMLRLKQSEDASQRSGQNIQIAREQKAQLDAQLERGEIDQSAYDRAYLDLQTELALELEHAETNSEETRGCWMVYVLLLGIPLLSVSLYFNFGEYRVVQDPLLVEARSQPAAPQMSIDEMIATIKQRLRDVPEDAEGWYALGRAYGVKRDFAKAATAYQRTYDLVGDQPEVLFSLADAIAMQNEGSLLGEPEALVKRGLEIAPRYPNGLWLAGLIAEQRQDYAKAYEYWTMLLPLIADNPQSTAEIKNLIGILEARDPSLVEKSSDPDAVALVTLQVDISPDLKAQSKPEQTVFIYAKAMQGPPMPLAVRRVTVADLPISVSLSDADAMLSTMKLSSFPRVIVGARVSPSGTATPQSGDFYTEVADVDSASPPESIDLTIDQVKQ